MTITNLTDKSQWNVAETVLWCFVLWLVVVTAERITCFVSKLMNMLLRLGVDLREDSLTVRIGNRVLLN
jgi:hypothetical protein